MNTVEYNLGFDAGCGHAYLVAKEYRVECLQAKADNAALHKGIRRLTKKVKELKEKLEHNPTEITPTLITEWCCEGASLERKMIVEYIREGVRIVRAEDENGEIEVLFQCAESIANDIERGEHLRDQS